ncbi:putative amino-acid metabolite efflux pump [compost metagenome]
MKIASLVRLLLLAALWGGSFLFMRIAAPALGSLVVSGARVSLGALGLVLLAALLRIPQRFDGKLRACLLLGVINSGIPFLLFAHAATVLPAGYSAILNALTPLMGVLIGAAAFDERITPRKLGGISLGIGGVIVLCEVGRLSASQAALGGIVACLGATACYALAGFLTKRWISDRGGLDSRMVALGSQLGAMLLLVPFMAWHASSASIAWDSIGPDVWLAMLALGLLCTSLAYVLYFRLIADEGPLKALSVTFLIPPFGMLWGWLVLSEPVTLRQVLGGILIAIALWLVVRPEKPRKIEPVEDWSI